MKLFSILLVLFVISQVFGGFLREVHPLDVGGYSRCLKKFKGNVCFDEDDCGPYGSCQMINGAFRTCVEEDGVEWICGV